jgi:hypothetical protein
MQLELRANILVKTLVSMVNRTILDKARLLKNPFPAVRLLVSWEQSEE